MVDNNMRIIKRDTPLTVTDVHDIRITLMASGDGTEIMKHQMEAGSSWTLMPETPNGELQLCFVVRGTIRWKSESERGVLGPGDSLAAHPVRGFIELYSETDVEYLFITSRPVFHLHTHGLQEMEQLAVKIEEKDGYTADHCARIKRLSLLLAEVLDVNPQEQFDTKLGSFLHDVGKVHVPNEILNKAGPLAQSEWDIMRKHPIFGRDMVRDLEQHYLVGASQVVEQHHERYDGSGYPLGLKGNDIHIGAAIVSVVDSFDAMTTDRVYRRAKPVHTALTEIRENRGKLYHPTVVDAFLTLNFEHF